MHYQYPIILAITGLCTTSVLGQQAAPPSLLFIGRVPVYFYHDMKGISINDSLFMHAPPGKLGIKPAYPPFNLFARALYQGHENPQYWPPGALYIKVETTTSTITSWKRLCDHNTALACEEAQVDIEIDLQPDSVYFISLSTNESDSTVLKFMVKVDQEQPNLLGWRTMDEPDKLANRTQPDLLEIKNVEKVFKEPLPVMQTNAAKFIQFKFKQPVPWADSFLEYRWYNGLKDKSHHWQTGGGLLTLPYNNRYRAWYLQVRYKGQKNAATFQLIPPPKWYQKANIQLLTGFVLLTMSLLVYYMKKTRKLKLMVQSETQLTNQLLSLQAHSAPHLLSNALAALDQMTEEKRWPEATIFIKKLSVLVKDSFEGRAQVYGSLESEMNRLRDFISIHQIRFGFQYREIFPENLRHHSILVPTGLFQPLVENAVKYNFSGQHNQNELIMRISENNHDLMIEIKAICHQPGCSGQQSFQHSTGFGLTWVNKRIAIHNQMNPNRKITLGLSLGADQSEAVFICKNHTKDIYV